MKMAVLFGYIWIVLLEGTGRAATGYSRFQLVGDSKGPIAVPKSFIEVGRLNLPAGSYVVSNVQPQREQSGHSDILETIVRLLPLAKDPTAPSWACDLDGTRLSGFRKFLGTLRMHPENCPESCGDQKILSLGHLKNSVCLISKEGVEASSTLMRSRNDFSPRGAARPVG